MSTPDQTDTQNAAVHRGRRTFILLAMVFAVPMVLAYTLYLSGWRPEGRSVHFGELHDPARPLPEVTLRDIDGAALPFSALRRHWLLVQVDRLPCKEACLAGIDKMERVRLAQGEKMRRVELVFIALDAPAAALRQLGAAHPALRVLGGERETLQRLARELTSREGTALDGAGRLYLVDPLGNLVLSYGADAGPREIHKDLARLLRLSQVG
jgi:hypothetical protein